MQEFLTGRFTLLAGLVVLAILGSMFLLLELGYRIGRRHREEGWRQGLGTLEGGVFGLMGLLLAFTFSGAASRFDARRTLIVEEANDIGTAWLRIDLLPVDAQRAIRDSFRSYVDARIATYRAMPDYRVAMEHNARMEQLQGVIWQQATTATREGWVGPNLLLPALNAMFDIIDSEGLLARVVESGKYLGGELGELVTEFPGYVTETRGRGLLRGVAVASGSVGVVAKCREKGLLLSVASDKVVRFAPPYIVERAQLDEAVGILRGVLQEVVSEAAK